MDNPIVLTQSNDPSHCTGEGLDVAFLNETAAQLSAATPVHEVLDQVTRYWTR